MQNLFQIGPVLLDKTIFKMLTFPLSESAAVNVLYGIDYVNNFERGTTKDHPCEIIFNFGALV